MAKPTESGYRCTTRFPSNLAAEISRYAVRNSLSFAEAVRRLCETALSNSSDEVYAPRLEKLLEKSDDDIVARLETAIAHAVDEVVTEIRLSEVRKATLLDDAVPGDDVGYSPNVFIPERLPGEKEVVWPQ